MMTGVEVVAVVAAAEVVLFLWQPTDSWSVWVAVCKREEGIGKLKFDDKTAG